MIKGLGFRGTLVVKDETEINIEHDMEAGLQKGLQGLRDPCSKKA